MSGAGQPAIWITAVIAAAVPAGWLGARIARAYADPPGRPTSLPMIAATLVVFAWAAMVTPIGPILAATLVLGWALVTLAAVDLLSFRLPDPLTLPLAGAGLAVSLLLPGAPILDHVVGLAAGYGLLAALRWIFERVRRREGIGLGDAKLLAAAGAWLGWRPLPSVLIIACGVAFIWIGLRVVPRGRAALRDRVAFGAPLCLAIWIVWLYGPLWLERFGYST